MTDYFDTYVDKYGNWQVDDQRYYHKSATAGNSEAGNMQYAETFKSYGVEIPYSAEAQKAETVFVDNSRADRGQDS